MKSFAVKTATNCYLRRIPLITLNQVSALQTSHHNAECLRASHEKHCGKREKITHSDETVRYWYEGQIVGYGSKELRVETISSGWPAQLFRQSTIPAVL